MLFMSETYFYDKYSKIVETTVEDTQTTKEPDITYTVYAPGIKTIDVYYYGYGGIIYLSYFRGAYTNYINHKIKVASGIYTYEFELTDPKLSPYPFNFHDENQIVVGETVYDRGDNWGYDSDSIVKGYVSFFDPRSGDIYMQITDVIYHGTSEVAENDIKTYNVNYSKGKFIETLVRNETYPINGPRSGDDYWWVRGKPFTIPAPELISPENAYAAHESDSELPYFVFELTSRTIAPGVNTDNNEYHARLRIGDRSDFANNIYVLLESKDDQSLWEYYDGSNWQPFPAGGVNAGTRVRVKPDINDITDWGFYYWDATAYNSNWGYGQSNFRMFVFITPASDGAYLLTIGGRRYYAIDLNIQEAANGELGQIDIKLVNNKI